MSKVVKRTVLVLVVLCIAAIAAVAVYGSRLGIYLVPPSPEQYVENALRIMDQGIYADGDEWETARAEALARASEIGSYEDAHELLTDAIGVAGGKHSSLIVDESDVTGQETQLPVVELDEDGILYVTIPSTDLGTPSSYYEDVLGFMAENREDIRAVIVDLRDNRGGDMGPMLAAVSPLLEDGNLLEFDIRGNRVPVTLIDGEVSGGGSTVQLEDAFKLEGIPVAILQNEFTGSSGEATLLAFRGLAHTRTFGTPTAGYCSCNNFYRLYDGAILNLTIGSDVARTGEMFCEDPIEPDVASGQPLEDARQWLLGEIA